MHERYWSVVFFFTISLSVFAVMTLQSHYHVGLLKQVEKYSILFYGENRIELILLMS